mmetsp:Transcript_34039/g.64805  ORF Transcript_34039/g.64805 Transcript_34039/m.64805 type:complete len:443 (-) Transcript_34039:190-1518(-)
MTFCQAKYFVLVLLVVQNTCLVLLMRYSRTRPGTMYLGSTAVCCDEAMKLVTCLCILAATYLYEKKKKGGSDGGGAYSQLNTSDTTPGGKRKGSDDCVDSNVGGENNDNGDSDNIAEANSNDNSDHESFRAYLRKELQFDFRMAGLAGLYTVQKNLLYLAISNLDAAVFQVTYQAKILTTAIFSVLILGRKLSCRKIVGLVILFIGVAIVQMDKVEQKASQSAQEQRKWVGVLAVLGACCTSGFGGVYFELVLKPRQTESLGGGDGMPPRSPPSVWAKNVQLSAFAFVIALATAFLKDHKIILADGFFRGYSPLVWLVISFEAGGGLVTAAVIKYADNILKSFATAVSIVTSTIVSAWVFGFVVSTLFVEGCLLVFVAIGLYSRKDKDAVDASSPSSAVTSPSKMARKELSDIAMVPVDSSNSISTSSTDEENGMRRKNRGL